MKEQIAVGDLIHGAVGIEEIDVAMQVVGGGKLGNELIDNVLLAGRERVGVCRIDGGKIVSRERPHAAVGKRDRSHLVVDLVEQQAVGHIELRVTLDNLPLELKEQHVDSLDQRADGLTGTVSGVCEGDKLAQGNAVIVLENLVVVVAQVVAQYRSDTGGLTGCSAHPEQVVVAPLDIERVVGKQAVHNLGRTAAAVEDVTHQMQVVDGETFDERGERLDKVVGTGGLKNRFDNALVIAHAIVILVRMRVQQLVDDIGIITRDGLTYLGAGIAARKRAGNHNELVEHRLVPGRRVLVLAADKVDFLARVVDERAQLALVVKRKRIAKNFVNMLAYDARAVVEDMHEGLVLAMQVAHKMLGALGQVEDGREIDDLGERGLLGGELSRQQAQILEVLRIAIEYDHEAPFDVVGKTDKQRQTFISMRRFCFDFAPAAELSAERFGKSI